MRFEARSSRWLALHALTLLAGVLSCYPVGVMAGCPKAARKGAAEARSNAVQLMKQGAHLDAAQQIKTAQALCPQPKDDANICFFVRQHIGARGPEAVDEAKAGHARWGLERCDAFLKSGPSKQNRVKVERLAKAIRSEASGTLIINSQPSNVAVTLAGRPIESGAAVVEGWLSLEAQAECHRAQTTEVLVTRGQTATATFLLEPVPAHLELASSPSGAQIDFDGVPQQARTPATLAIPAGSVTISLRKDGYESSERTVSLACGATLRVDEVLVQTPTPAPKPAPPVVSRSPWIWRAAALSGTAFAASGLLTVTMLLKADDADQALQDGRTNTAITRLRRDAQDQERYRNVSLGIALAAAGGAFAAWYFEDAAVSVPITPTPGGAAVFIRF